MQNKVLDKSCHVCVQLQCSEVTEVPQISLHPVQPQRTSSTGHSAAQTPSDIITDLSLFLSLSCDV